MKAYGGFKFHVVCGYPGSMEFPLVLARGEVDVISGAWNAWKRRADVIDGTLRPVIQSGLRRHRELPDVPLMQDLLDDPGHKQVAAFLSSGSAIGRALLVHKAVPAERIAALRAAFDQLVKDPQFIADAERAGAELDPDAGRRNPEGERCDRRDAEGDRRPRDGGAEVVPAGCPGSAPPGDRTTGLRSDTYNPPLRHRWFGPVLEVERA